MSDRKDTYFGDDTTQWGLAMRDGAACFYCDHPFSPSMEGLSHMAIEHVIPKSKGDTVEDVEASQNLRLSCTECNSAKGNKTLDGEKLAVFRLRRRLKRQRDEQWVRWQHQLMRELRSIPLGVNPPTPDDLAGKLIGKLSASPLCSDVKRYTRATKQVWISFHTEPNGSDESWQWYFCTNSFRLQPHTLGWHEPMTVIDDFELMGYFKDELRCKYVEPFISQDKGVAIIEAEVQAVEAMWRLRPLPTSVASAESQPPDLE
ncbi:MAG: HNH endonuclease [Lentisphaerae bacterium]|nr:HNH endonuclease [Lentisphaerota bacterium]